MFGTLEECMQCANKMQNVDPEGDSGCDPKHFLYI